MSQKMYNVRVCLTENCPDSIEEILHGPGFSLGPTQDKVQEIAKQFKGSFADWEPLCCDYSFSSKKSANRFIETVNKTFNNQVFAEITEIESTVNNGSFMRVYKELPSNVVERIAALTPPKIGFLDVEIRYIEDTENLNLPQEEKYENFYRTTHINMQCEVTGKIRSKMIALRSSTLMNKMSTEFELQKSPEFQRAMNAGWTRADINYDALVRAVLVPTILNTDVGGDQCPELQFACTKAVVVVHDYHGQQYVGCYFYNENLDKPLNFSSFSI